MNVDRSLSPANETGASKLEADERPTAAGVVRGDFLVVEVRSATPLPPVILRAAMRGTGVVELPTETSDPLASEFAALLAAVGTVEAKLGEPFARVRLCAPLPQRAVLWCQVGTADREGFRPIAWADPRIGLECLCPDSGDAFWRSLAYWRSRVLDLETLRFTALQTWRNGDLDFPFRLSALVIALYKSIELGKAAPSVELDDAITYSKRAVLTLKKGNRVRTDRDHLRISVHFAAAHYQIFTSQYAAAVSTLDEIEGFREELWGRRQTLAYNFAKALLMRALAVYATGRVEGSREAFLALHRLFYLSTRHPERSATVFKDLRVVHEAAWLGLRAVKCVEERRPINFALMKEMRLACVRVTTPAFQGAFKRFLDALKAERSLSRER